MVRKQHHLIRAQPGVQARERRDQQVDEQVQRASWKVRLNTSSIRWPIEEHAVDELWQGV